MARWSRSRLRNFGIGAVAVLGGSLLVIPAISQAEEEPAPAAAAARPDRVAMIPGKLKGRSGFEFKPASKNPDMPYGFVSTGGELRVQQLSGSKQAPATAKTEAPARAARVAAAAATTYSTTLTIASENWSAWNSLFNLWNRDTWTYVSVPQAQNSLSTKVNLPPGNYYAAVIYGIYQQNSYLLTKAFTVTDRGQTVVLDEKGAKETAIKVDDSTARRDQSAVWMSVPGGDMVGFAGGPQARTFVTTASTTGTTLRVHELLTKAGTSANKPSPYRYDLMRSWAHPLPASPIATVATSSLAKRTTAIRAQGVNTEGAYMTVPNLGEWTGVYLQSSMRVPASFTEYVTPGVSWSRLATYGSDQYLNLPDRTLTAGANPAETVGEGPLVPTRWGGGADSHREGDTLWINENMVLGDTAGNRGWDYQSAFKTTLSSGGQVLQTANAATLQVPVPAVEQTYQLEQTSVRKVAWSQLSTRTRSEWTFASGPVNGVLPLMDLGFAATGLDQRNRASATPVKLTVKPSTRTQVAKNTVDKVEWSADEGQTWAELPLTEVEGGSQVTLEVPATAAFVALRVTASNDHGGSLRRTIRRALAGPATSKDETIGATSVSNLKLNDGKGIVIGTSGSGEFFATFTASDPSGIAGAGLYLYHGDYNTPDGLFLGRTECVPASATTANCTASMYNWDTRWTMGSNTLAGSWKAAVWATAKDGAGFTDRHAQGSMTFKRYTTLNTDATPEPVKKGKSFGVNGTLKRANWDTWAYQGYPSVWIPLQYNKKGTSTWSTVKSVKTDGAGIVRTTTTATADGSYRYNYPGDATTAPVTSGADYLDVQ